MSERLGTQLQSGGLEQSIHTGLLGKGMFAGASLDLNFAATKNIGPLVTFTRASSGTYVDSQGVLQTAATDVPRFDHNPTTGESLGLLVEESRTNLCLQSENFSTTWLPTGLLAFGSGSTANAIAAPDGQITADLLVENTAASNHMVAQSINVTTGTVYTVSAFAKAAPTTRKLQLLVSNTNFGVTPSAIFDLATGTITGNSNSTAIITPFPGGWYRVTMTTIAATSTGANSASIRLVDASNANSYTGDGTSGIYLWGAQLEAGAFATSYISTTTAAATRSADVATDITRGAALRALYAQFRSPASGTRPVVSLDYNSANERIELFTSGTDPKLLVTDDGSTQADLDAGSITANITARLAARFNTDNFAASVSGGAEVLDATGTMPTVDRVRIGSNQAGNYLNGTIARITGWDAALPTLPSFTQ